MKQISYVIMILFMGTPALLLANSPLAVGDHIPTPFTVVDQSGEQQNFASLTGTNGVVIFFVRSLDWCPFCQQQIMRVNDNHTAFEEAGYHVISVSYDPVETLARFSNQRNIEIPLLSDPDSSIIKEFGILNQDHEPDSRFHGIPDPTIYVVDANGKITSILAEEGYKNRPEIDDVLNALD